MKMSKEEVDDGMAITRLSMGGGRGGGSEEDEDEDEEDEEGEAAIVTPNA